MFQSKSYSSDDFPALAGGLVQLLFAIETKGRVLEELSP
jgi:hypothetical protein